MAGPRKGDHDAVDSLFAQEPAERVQLAEPWEVKRFRVVGVVVNEADRIEAKLYVVVHALHQLGRNLARAQDQGALSQARSAVEVGCAPPHVRCWRHTARRRRR